MVTSGVFVCMKTIERVMLCLFSPYLMFFIRDNRRRILSYQIRQLPCHARGARAHNLFSLLQFRMVSFVHEHGAFFPLIDKLMSTIESNQTLDALTKYVE